MCLMTHIGSSFGGVTGKIAGSVADRETGEGLPGVEIGLRGSTVFGINAL